jgi:hypothetical protein
MLRLGVSGGNNEWWPDVARRLRGASLGVVAPGQEAACDALVLLDAQFHVEGLFAAGKHVLLADMTAMTAERFDAWSGLTRPGGPRLAALNPERFRPSRLLIRQQLEQNLGALGLIRVQRWVSCRPSYPTVTNDVDVILWLMGRAPDVVFALRVGDGSVFQAHLGFPGGGMALACFAVGRQYVDYSSLSLIAASGAAYVDDHADQHLLVRDGLPHSFCGNDDVLTLAAMVQTFVDGLARGTDFSPTLTTLRPALAVRCAILDSLEKGQPVKSESV